jgi:histidine ammonia-lyase
VGAGRKVLISDVAKVACLNYSVGLDSQSLEKIDGELSSLPPSPPFKLNKSALSAISRDAQYHVSLCRAAVFVRIVSLMQGRSAVRSVVIQLLADMLDAGVVPNFSSASNAGIELVAALIGADTTSYFRGSVMSTATAFSRAGLSPIELTTAEALTIQYSQFWATSVSCLVTAGAANLVSIMDSVSALSCESFGVNVEHFDAIHFDTCRQHRGQMASSTNLRLLLEGSKRVNTATQAVVSFDCIPQINGPAQEVISAAVK